MADLLGRAQVQAEQREALGREFRLNPTEAFGEGEGFLPLATNGSVKGGDQEGVVDSANPPLKSPFVQGGTSTATEFEEFLPEGVTPQAAADYVRAKVAVTRSAYDALLKKNRDRYKDYAFFISGTESVPLIEAAQQAVAKSIEDGLTFQQFEALMQEAYQKLGVTPLSPWHLETVFRTNILSAYQVGRYQQLTDPAVKKALPYWQYRGIMDSRIRPAHAAMNLFIAPVDDPIWKTWYPPNGYNCRCTVTALGGAEAQQLAAERGQDLRFPAGARLPAVEGVPVRPDRGFEENPIVHFERSMQRRAGALEPRSETPPLGFEQILEEAETRIRANPLERAIVLDSQGKVVLEKGGSRNSVSFSAAEMSQMGGSILTHNHPRGTSFSREDVLFAATSNLAEIRVATRQWRFSLKRPQQGWSQRFWDEEIAPAYRRHAVRVEGEFWAAIRKGELSPADAELRHAHEVWSRVSEELGLEYRREAWVR